MQANDLMMIDCHFDDGIDDSLFLRYFSWRQKVILQVKADLFCLQNERMCSIYGNWFR